MTERPSSAKRPIEAIPFEPIALEASTGVERPANARSSLYGIARLCSEEVSFVTGEALAIDGGYLSR